ncbi:hypothetical protein, partial [Klebsiella quasipneumoniae]
MHVLHHHAAANAAGTIDPRGRAIALSVVFAAGALLFIMAPVIGASGTLGLLALLIAAFGAGWGFARAQPWLYRAPLTATRWAFLVSAAGWLLALVAWYGGQAWPALLPGVTFGSAGAAVAWRVAVGRAALSGRRVSGATALSVAVAIAATLLTWHTAGAGRGGVNFAFAVLLDW